MPACITKQWYFVVSGLSKAKRDDMIVASEVLHCIFTSLVFLAKQGLAIRGETDVTSNLSQLLSLRADDDASVQS